MERATPCFTFRVLFESDRSSGQKGGSTIQAVTYRTCGTTPGLGLIRQSDRPYYIGDWQNVQYPFFSPSSPDYPIGCLAWEITCRMDRGRPICGGAEHRFRQHMRGFNYSTHHASAMPGRETTRALCRTRDSSQRRSGWRSSAATGCRAAKKFRQLFWL